jgi:hypothetical protein
MPPRWGTVIVCVFGMVGSEWEGWTCFFGGLRRVGREMVYLRG